jgi:hypothetical protein
MRTDPRKGKRHRTKRGVSAGEAVRALITTAALGGILLLAVFVTAGSYFSTQHRAESALTKIEPLSPSGGGEAAHRIASIVLDPQNKGRCEERHFVNRTGRIVSSNVVNCEARLAPERDTSSSDSTNRERMRAILGAFKK